MTARLILARHGETPANVRHELDSRPPGPPLTEMGRRQADALAERLAGEPVVGVYASVAVRAQETAEPVAKRHGLSVEVVEGIHEIQCGDLEGRSDADALRAFGEVYTRWTEGDLAATIPGGDNGELLRARYLPAIERILACHDDGLVVVVSHGGVIRLAAEWMADNVGPQLAYAQLLPNTGHVLLENRGGGWHALEWTGVDL
ncbi:histidine phosphatase family protein [Actinokineospora sp. NBRC 105648]|uniref:histidine phosphatase family protein n=1 Tax=Actinokineospora sp. NBRC 105648 TaxID=3032206 RepID=UPI0024A16D8F|nr:histidine phosphatase family protein [Actinokineospora sp. NBRC 105648]GLZ43116.1 phosphoglycerate mutase [Actinokineospora sp. NBRC 105648]